MSVLERLTENLRVGQTPAVSAQMFLMFRVLLLRISPQHLTSLWPIMVTELVRTMFHLFFNSYHFCDFVRDAQFK